MKIEKNWKPLIGSVGLIVLMMTAATVSADDVLDRDGTQLLDDSALSDSPVDNEGDAEPMLIAVLSEENETTSPPLPDYQNYTGDMLLSPGPAGDAAVSTQPVLPILGIIGAVVVSAVLIFAFVIKRKQ